jgi:2-polyprenyl-3-methyl-5-hydroxy-6-metoxy-1,4-benzoquinol methylase
MTERHKTLSQKLLGRLRYLRNYFRPEWRLARNADWQNQSSVLQPWPVTSANRHPDFFALAAGAVSANPAPRILSFGCATGEEVFALAELLPDAQIDGIDINPACIAKAQQRLKQAQHHRLHFAVGDKVPTTREHYDAIFCLSVLRHARLDAEQPGNCEAIMPFARYAAFVDAFDHTLKPGGMLFLWGTNFRFADTDVARRYRTIAVPGRRHKGGTHYGRDNQRLLIDGNPDCVFEKMA